MALPSLRTGSERRLRPRPSCAPHLRRDTDIFDDSCDGTATDAHHNLVIRMQKKGRELAEAELEPYIGRALQMLQDTEFWKVGDVNFVIGNDRTSWFLDGDGPRGSLVLSKKREGIEWEWISAQEEQLALSPVEDHHNKPRGDQHRKNVDPSMPFACNTAPLESDVPNEDEEKRFAKREQMIGFAKDTDDYRRFVSLRLHRQSVDGVPPTPRHTDRTISKRTWEKLVREWRLALSAVQ